MDHPPQAHPEPGVEPLLISVDEAARMLGISPWLCYKLIKDGELQARKVGRRKMVNLAAVRQYAAASSGQDSA